MNLTLDLYIPTGAAAGQLFPAIMLAHGGGNSGGDKNQTCFIGSAEFFAARGFVAANIDYRLSHDNGPTPPAPSTAVRNYMEWTPSWASGYPAVRDTKAAIRFLRSLGSQIGFNTSALAVSGGSAGATNVLTTGVVFEDDYKNELSVEQDPTLLSTHLNESSSVQLVYTHWSSDGEIRLIQEYDGQNRTRYRPQK
jgi:acetyl esterase/lipase